MTAGLLGTEAALQDTFDVALVDLDGVAYKGANAIPSAPPALGEARDAGMAVVFVTNNASREPETVAEHLAELGIPCAPHEVMTAAQAGAELLAEHIPAGQKVLVVGGAGLYTAVHAKGYVIVESADDHPAAVIQGFAPNLGWKELAEATYAINAGARYFATNLDLTLPTERGFAPGNGSLVGVVRTATGVDPLAAGKPEPAMLHMAARKAGASRPLMIGDRLDTDLKGARAAEVPGLLVLTGVSTARDAVLAVPGERPSFIGEDLSTLAESHPLPVLAESWWHVGDARARVTDGHLSVDGGSPIDRVRAACAAAWEAADSGARVDVDTLPHFG
ncbi:HAD-IIA family hydrolase [Demequina mangrovi]|uniref:HAD-superfamily subfamily IIA hydrolase, TIGR01457 n=1 Tax=Demequina mangrovi TaxID=1043493 RepID=A0A1H7AX60_9MICO|nr:HAD-IIA family hydrolase [Demequina mangrovi]SEJ70189.1 HAD-superfamily subfamily IIA hydrolase, TIGR01457 [Demequina mangrovi]